MHFEEFVEEAFEHEAGESEEMHFCQCLSQAFVVASQATEAGYPCKASFDDPASGQ